ncbi:MAG: hypothetical protein AAF846_22105 [Chloroflexota bacterium]
MSYQLHCPNCSTAIPPENINVQKTIAACANCGAVFNFSDKVGTTQKIKRRKSKKPDNITQTETANSLKLEMPLLQTMSYKIGTGMGAIAALGFYLFILANVLPDNDPSDIVPMIVVGAMIIPFALSLLASFFATQSIEASAEELKHEVRLGVPLYQRKMSADDIVDVSTEEMTSTRESIAEARYNIYAEKYDNRQDMFMQNLPEEMAIYAQQTLSGYFNTDDADASLRLQDDMDDVDEMLIIDEQEQQQQQSM